MLHELCMLQWIQQALPDPSTHGIPRDIKDFLKIPKTGFAKCQTNTDEPATWVALVCVSVDKNTTPHQFTFYNHLASVINSLSLYPPCLFHSQVQPIRPMARPTSLWLSPGHITTRSSQQPIDCWISKHLHLPFYHHHCLVLHSTLSVWLYPKSHKCGWDETCDWGSSPPALRQSSLPSKKQEKRSRQRTGVEGIHVLLGR